MTELLSTGAPAAESTFMVFTLDGVPVGVPTAAVESVSPDAAVSLSRLLVLRGRQGVPPPLLRTQGALRVVSVLRSQVVALPPLCVTTGSACTELALLEDQILFLIIDPYRLTGLTSEAGVVPSPQESR